MTSTRRAAVCLPLLALLGCGSPGGSSSADASGGPLANSRDHPEPRIAAGDLRLLTDPRIALADAGDGSGDSIITLSAILGNDTGAAPEHELLVDGASQGAATSENWSLERSWRIGPGRHRLELVLDPRDLVGEIDEANNEAIIIVDVPVATSPTSRVGTDLTFAYPPYVTFIALPEQNQVYGDYWAYMVWLPMRNNGSNPIASMRTQLSGDHGGSSLSSGDYAPGATKLVGMGRGVPALAPLRIGVALDPLNELVEVDEGDNAFQLDLVTPPPLGPSANG